MDNFFDDFENDIEEFADEDLVLSSAVDDQQLDEALDSDSVLASSSSKLTDELDLEDEEEEAPLLESIKNISQKSLKEKIKRINNYKKQNLKCLSRNFCIGLLCKVTEFIKNGGLMLDGKTDFDYPNDTEESIAIEAILTGKTPFVWHVGENIIEYNDTKALLTVMKLAIRCANDNPIILSPNFRKRWPIFIKNLYNDYISEEELEEANKNS